ncbi:hypothetical protein O3P69_018918 [Scylla paramamosain]|uniref:Uncharacterized protein n=1 Tax=Scylla paramamosain TaxID=85552 RepID=A0AAW0SGI3_SCYPA
MAATASLEASAVNRDKPEAVGQLSDNRDLAKDHTVTQRKHARPSSHGVILKGAPRGPSCGEGHGAAS